MAAWCPVPGRAQLSKGHNQYQRGAKKVHRFSLGHVSDDSIGDDQEDEVLGTVRVVPRDVGHVVDRGCEVGRTVKLYPAEAALVSSKNS